jgi:hypothetical protein
MEPAQSKHPISLLHTNDKTICSELDFAGVINVTKTLKFIPNFLDFFQSLYVLAFDHGTPVLILAKQPF